MKFLLLMVASGGFGVGFDPAMGQDWMQTSAPPLNWLGIASSADGSKLAAIAPDSTGPIYISTNSGTTWVQSGAPGFYFRAVASSADGTTLVASGYASPLGSLVCVSTNSGATWTSNSVHFGGFTGHIASSADGRKLVIAGGEGYSSIFTSTNSGATWRSNSAPFQDWSVTCSADGTKLLAAARVGQMYRSTNSGMAWELQSAPSVPWTSIACSEDATVFVAGTYYGTIYTSKDSGRTWSTNGAPGGYEWISVSSSADGTRLAAVAYGGPIYTSTNSGVTWQSNSAPSKSWISVASSADGHKLVAAAAAVDSAGGIYASTSIPAPLVSITSGGGNLLLSWIVPSRDFILQQNPDLTTTSWTDVTATPTLNYANLQYQLILPLTAEPMFYRLMAL